jgi:hypothetical protein
MKTLAIYHRSVPNAKNKEKTDLLLHFAQGARAAGDNVIDAHGYSLHSADVAVIQGWVHEGSKTGQHLTLRNSVIKNQLADKKYVVAVDSNVFLYATPDNPLHYLRYSFNGIFPNTGIYCDTKIDPTRWQKISQSLNIQIKPYRTAGDHILLCLQRNGGWSMGKVSVADWARQTIAQLRQYTKRPIVVRAHPGDKKSKDYISTIQGKNVSLSTNTSLLADLKNCWAAVNHNSSAVVGAAIEGVPIFVTDCVRSQCQGVANTNLARIEYPLLPDRQAWAERLAMSHWNFDELQSGECWRHMRKFI